MTRRRGRTDRGVATVWAIGLVALLGLVAVVVAQVGGFVVGQRRAEAAADLAALAGAAALQRGADTCRVAEDVAVRNGARMTACLVSGREVRVQVDRDVVAPLLGGATLHARARAGPV